MNGRKKILLAGNANVGKSTVFNELTGMSQHTGNWTGKTVDSASGGYYYKFVDYTLVDLPGTYSITGLSEEEKIASDIIKSNDYDCVVCVVDATCLERNLKLVLEILELTDKAVLLLNLCDEAEKKNISINVETLSKLLGIPVVRATARSGKGINELLETVHLVCSGGIRPAPVKHGFGSDEGSFYKINALAGKIAFECVTRLPSKKERIEARLDRILLGKYSSIPVMLALIALVMWLTVVGSNYPSQLLQQLFSFLEERLAGLLISVGVSEGFVSLAVYGALRVLFWVVAVMLPPMAVFFPMFSYMEELGLLPRLAFNTDSAFACCGGCGKQALTTCMGYGCNAVGVTGCRIIDSPKERLVAILTNSLTPCNGRFPLLIAIITMFFAKSSFACALLLTAFLCASIVMTLLCSLCLSKTVLKGEQSIFVLELPSFRKPKIPSLLKNTMKQKVLKVLCRAVITALPAGLIIWLFANVSIDGVSLLAYASRALDPVGRFLGMDGVMLLAFILAFPANEIVLPVALMVYLSQGEMSSYSSLSELREILVANGWTVKTALCTCMFSMFHFPCSTTLLTVYRETKSFKWTALSVLTPLLAGVTVCALCNFLMSA